MVWSSSLTTLSAFEKRLPDNWHTRLFVPTGAYPRAQYKAAAVKPPFERDLKVIESFIECANRLLPDDTARERAGLKLGDLRYTARSPRDLHPPFYLEARREVRSYALVILDPPPTC